MQLYVAVELLGSIDHARGDGDSHCMTYGGLNVKHIECERSSRLGCGLLASYTTLASGIDMRPRVGLSVLL